MYWLVGLSRRDVPRHKPKQLQARIECVSYKLSTVKAGAGGTDGGGALSEYVVLNTDDVDCLYWGDVASKRIQMDEHWHV